METKFICFVIRCRKVRQEPCLELDTLDVRLGSQGNLRVNVPGLQILPWLSSACLCR